MHLYDRIAGEVLHILGMAPIANAVAPIDCFPIGVESERRTCTATGRNFFGTICGIKLRIDLATEGHFQQVSENNLIESIEATSRTETFDQSGWIAQRSKGDSVHPFSFALTALRVLVHAAPPTVTPFANASKPNLS